MSEQYPTQAEYQEILNEHFAHDPELYNYIMYCESEEPTELDLDALEEGLYMTESADMVDPKNLPMAFDGLSASPEFTYSKYELEWLKRMEEIQRQLIEVFHIPSQLMGEATE